MGVEIDHQKIEVDEIQSRSLEEIVERKARQAYDVAKRPVFVDDYSFWLDDLDGMPGPFIKFFIGSNIKLEKLCRLADGLSSRRATCRAYFGYFDGETFSTLYGELKGHVVEHPRGTDAYGIGTDFVFAVDGYGGKTRAELDEKTYDEVYRKMRAADDITRFLEGKGYK